MILVSSQVSARKDSSKERQLEGIKNEAQVSATKKKIRYKTIREKVSIKLIERATKV